MRKVLKLTNSGKLSPHHLLYISVAPWKKKNQPSRKNLTNFFIPRNSNLELKFKGNNYFFTVKEKKTLTDISIIKIQIK